MSEKNYASLLLMIFVPDAIAAKDNDPDKCSLYDALQNSFQIHILSFVSA